MKRTGWILAAVLAVTPAAWPAAAPPARPPEAMKVLDRVVVRWHAPETGGPARPQFIFERELAFEARLESLADPDPEPGPYHDRHVRAALDRHVAESLLAALPILPAPDPQVVARRAETARGILEDRVHGRPGSSKPPPPRASDRGARRPPPPRTRRAPASTWRR